MIDDFMQPNLGKVEQEEDIQIFTYVCSSCHTSFHSADSNITTCVYCGGPRITKEEAGPFSDTSYIPFVLTPEEVMNIYKSHTYRNPLLPLSFRGKKVQKQLQKAYVLCSLYDISVEGSITFYGADRIQNIKNAPKQVFECLYSTHFDYSDLLISNYARMNDVFISNINDYDFTKLVDFDSLITRDGCLIEGDVLKTDVSEKVQERVLKQCIGIVRGNVGHELKKLSSNRLAVGFSSTKSIFVPIYFINHRYKGQEYLFIVNGQTGKSIIDVPSSKGNLFFLSVFLFLLFVLIGLVVAYFL